MPTYVFSIEPYSYIDSQAGLKWSAIEFKSAGIALSREHEIDQIQAFLNVSLNPDPIGEQVLCVMDPHKKHAMFRTFREEQELDLILRPTPELEGRIHFLKAVVIDRTHKPKGARVEYLDTTVNPPKWKHKPFEKDLPGRPQRVRIVFGMKGKTDPFNYNIYIRDLDGNEEGQPCDPQTSNDPPQA